MSDSELRRKLLEKSIRTSQLGKAVNTPVAEKRVKFEESHKRKTFWIDYDICKCIEEDTKTYRGEMTRIVNSLFREYYRKQGRIQ